jgi:hypothetical protein
MRLAWPSWVWMYLIFILSRIARPLGFPERILIDVPVSHDIVAGWI